MINLNEPRRPKKTGSDLWFYGAGSLALGLIVFFGFDKGRDGVSWIYVGLFMLIIYFVARKRNKVLRRVLVILGYIATGLITGFSGVRHLSPFVNPVQPHLEMQATQINVSNQRGSLKAKPGYIFRVFILSFESRLFARVEDVYVSRFGLEIGSNLYEDSEPFWEARNDQTFAQSCHARDLKLAPNATITCQLAFEVPRNASNGVLFYDSSDYKAWADVSF